MVEKVIIGILVFNVIVFDLDIGLVYGLFIYVIIFGNVNDVFIIRFIDGLVFVKCLLDREIIGLYSFVIEVID